VILSFNSACRQAGKSLMTQTGQVPGDDSNSGLTAPGLVKATTFKVGKSTLLSRKILFNFAHSFNVVM
jgi:hypothetical protein